MASSPTRKLRTPFEGVLAGGADPSSSALYSFGPFVEVIAAAGAAGIAYGASIWLVVVATIVTTLVYGLVMRWVRNGGGGSGLSEEEFGGWAIKVNGGITYILYIVAFLVGTAAAATFLADRLPAVRDARVVGISGTAWMAILLTLAIAWLANNRPGAVSRVYGPATGAVLVLLWVMIVMAVVDQGVNLPGFQFAAVQPGVFFGVAVAGFTRLLAMLTGIEVFATLEPAFEGSEAERSRRAFGSLLIVALNTVAVLLLLGPVFVAVSQPENPVSVFTQTMDVLLPGPLPWLGTAIAVAALLVVATASAQGLQNLVLGLRDRHYAPAFLGQRNRAEVPDWPVRTMALAAIVCFIFLDADPATYVRVYVAGFVALLTVASWAAAKRSMRQVREGAASVPLVFVTGAAAVFISLAAAAVVIEGFLAGIFIYIVLVPVFFVVFHYTRRAMGTPNPLRDELGRRRGELRGLGTPPGSAAPANSGQQVRSRLPTPELLPAPEGADRGALRRWTGEPARVNEVILALDGSEFAERALPAALAICRLFDASLFLVSVLPARSALRVLPKGRTSGNPLEAGQAEMEGYLERLAGRAKGEGIRAEIYLASGPVAQALDMLANELDVDLLVMSTHGRSGVGRFMLGSAANATIQLSSRPVLLLRTQALAAEESPRVTRVLAPLDGSAFAEQVLPWLQAVSAVSSAEIVLLTIPEVSEPAQFGSMYEAVDELRERAEANARRYVEDVAGQLKDHGVAVRTLVTGSQPATVILDVAEREHVDLIMLATHGRGGMERLVLGSVADRVVHHASCPVFLLPVHETRVTG